jgi:hypothetical protein
LSPIGEQKRREEKRREEKRREEKRRGQQQELTVSREDDRRRTKYLPFIL